MRRRVLIPLLLCVLSGLYWLWVWALVQSRTVGIAEDSVEAVFATLQANAAVYQATWAYVIGVIGIHGALAVWSYARKDREARAGVVVSGALHLVFLLASGIVAL